MSTDTGHFTPIPFEQKISVVLSIDQAPQLNSPAKAINSVSDLSRLQGNGGAMPVALDQPETPKRDRIFDASIDRGAFHSFYVHPRIDRPVPWVDVIGALMLCDYSGAPRASAGKMRRLPNAPGKPEVGRCNGWIVPGRFRSLDF